MTCAVSFLDRAEIVDSKGRPSARGRCAETEAFTNDD